LTRRKEQVRKSDIYNRNDISNSKNFFLSKKNLISFSAWGFLVWQSSCAVRGVEADDRYAAIDHEAMAKVPIKKWEGEREKKKEQHENKEVKSSLFCNLDQLTNLLFLYLQLCGIILRLFIYYYILLFLPLVVPRVPLRWFSVLPHVLSPSLQMPRDSFSFLLEITFAREK
jgi:hypothetical protein